MTEEVEMKTGNMHSKDIFKDVLIKIARGYFILVNVLGIFYTNFTNLLFTQSKSVCSPEENKKKK